MAWESFTCSVCLDGQGFFVRPCPVCERQKPADIRHARLYGVKVGERVRLPGPEAAEEQKEAA